MYIIFLIIFLDSLFYLLIKVIILQSHSFVDVTEGASSKEIPVKSIL